jgi:hypothetical protein
MYQIKEDCRDIYKSIHTEIEECKERGLEDVQVSS